MRKSYFVLSNDATNDLSSLAEYLKFVSGADLAEKILTRFYHLFTLLAHWPDIGRTHSELTDNPRSFTMKPWIIFYDQIKDSESVRILRVLDGRRDLPTLLPKRQKRY
jgi:toxin ParE1/3/4